MVARRCLSAMAICLLLNVTMVAFARGPEYTDPESAGEEFAIQGEYVGDLATEDGRVRLGAQVVSEGNGTFQVSFLVGGLPGDGWNRSERHAATGQLKDGAVVMKGERGAAEIRDGKITVNAGQASGTLKRVVRKSSTLGQPPPDGAIVLFDGTTAEHFKGGRRTDDGLLMPGCTSLAEFGDCQLHLEFQLPFEPLDRGQGRGNSGIYVQGRYEVQMLDSFGLEGKHNECGGVYEVRDPDLNMCYPPLSWQTYDIDFTAAKYDDTGQLTAPPRITVRHNGVLIHNDIVLPGSRSTRAAPRQPGPEPGPIYLQDHGSPVRYRNIWVVQR